MTDFASHISLFLREIIESEQFDFEDFHRRKFTLSQGFCLLWQNPKTGEVSGRTIDEVLHEIAVVTVLLDLMVLEKIAFQLEKQSFLTRAIFPTSRQIIVKVIDRNRTGTYLDDCLFNRILKSDKEVTVNQWISKTMSFPSHVLSTILKSLVKMGIFEVEQRKFDRRYPTLNPDPQQELRKEVQRIALHGQIPDSYMRSLLKLTRGCDALEASTTPILEHQFDYNDYPRAVENIERLIMKDTSDKHKEKKYKTERDTFDDIFNLDI